MQLAQSQSIVKRLRTQYSPPLLSAFVQSVCTLKTLYPHYGNKRLTSAVVVVAGIQLTMAVFVFFF